MKLFRYSSIPNLYREEAKGIFSLDKVVVQEKIDGTNFSFGIQDGHWFMNSRNNRMWLYHGRDKVENHMLQFDGFGAVNKFKELFGMKPFVQLQAFYPGQNIQVFGEFYGKGIQKRINYGEDKYFAFFDAYDLDKEEWFNWNDFLVLIEIMKLTMVPLFNYIEPSLERFEHFLSKKSLVITAGENEPIEGIVIKGLENETDYRGNRLIVKYKTEKFAEISKEKHRKVKPEDKGKYNFAQYVCEKYLTESRLENCLEKLRSENVPMSIKITGKVVSYLQNDVLEEMEEEDKNHISFDERFLRKILGAKSAELYKGWLVK